MTGSPVMPTRARDYSRGPVFVTEGPKLLGLGPGSGHRKLPIMIGGP